MKFNSLDDVGAEFVRAAELETNSLFVQGEIVLEATTQGWPIDEVTAHCAGLVRRSKRTVYRRYAVSRTFSEPHPALTTNWELHAIVCDLIDYRSTDADVIASQVAAANKWLDMAAAEEWSTRQLKSAMKENGDDPDKGAPQYLLEGVEMTYAGDDGNGTFKFFTREKIQLDVQYGERVRLSVLKAPAQESEAA